MRDMESGGLGDLFGDPEELQRRLAEFAEQMQGQQRLAWADNAIKLAVDMTVAAVNRVNLQGNAEAQAEQIRTVMARHVPRSGHARARGARGASVGLNRGGAAADAAELGARAVATPARSASRSARVARSTSLKERKRKMKTTAPARQRGEDARSRSAGPPSRRPHAVRGARAKTLTSSACCTPAPPGVKGTAPATG